MTNIADIEAIALGVVNSALQPGYTVTGNIISGPFGTVQFRGCNVQGFQAGSSNSTANNLPTSGPPPHQVVPYNIPQWAWGMNVIQQISALQNLGFNSIRLPISPDTIHQTRVINDYNQYLVTPFNPELQDKTPLQALDMFMTECESRGMYVLLDMHQTSGMGRNPTPLFLDVDEAEYSIWNHLPYTIDSWLADLTYIASRYSNNRRLVGIDLYNEPNSVLRWATGDSLFDPTATTYSYWHNLVEVASAAILAVNPNLLMFVEGMDTHYDTTPNPNIWTGYGETFLRIAREEVVLDIPRSKLVLTPHTYGPDVTWHAGFNQPSGIHKVPDKWTDPSFPANLPAEWDILYGDLAAEYPIVIGEFGGGTGQSPPEWGDDAVWFEAYLTYLTGKGIKSGFWWAQINSSDTASMLASDYSCPNPDILARLQEWWIS